MKKTVVNKHFTKGKKSHQATYKSGQSKTKEEHCLVKEIKERV